MVRRRHGAHATRTAMGRSGCDRRRARPDRRDAGADAVLHRGGGGIRRHEGAHELRHPRDSAGHSAADGYQQRRVHDRQVHPGLSRPVIRQKSTIEKGASMYGVVNARPSHRVRTAAILILTAVAACTTRLAPAYDQTIVDGLASVNKDTQTLFASI